MNCKKAFILFISIFCLCVNTSAQKINSSSGEFIEFANNSRQSNRIPIKIVNNQLLVELTLDHNLTVNFLLDTGVSTTIITDPIIASFLNLEYVRDIKVRGYGREEPLTGFVAKDFDFKLNDKHVFADRSVIVLDEALSLSNFLGEPIYGIIGYEIFKDYRVEINYLAQSIKLASNKKPLRKRRKYEVIPIDIRGNKPYISVEITDNAKLDSMNVLVDTGFSGALSLFPKEKNGKYIEDPAIENYRGTGINGAILSTLKKLERIDIGKYELHEVTTNFLDSSSLVNFNPSLYSDGSIGGEVLKRYRVIIDYQHKEIALKKNMNYKKKFNYNIAGLRIRSDDEQSRSKFVDTVRPDSPSFEAGIRENDKIIRLNHKSTKFMNYERIYAELNDLNEPNKTIMVERGEEVLTFEIFLQDVF